MVKLNKIYTKTGDTGHTGLANGERRAKNDIRIEAYGSVDETNSALGLALISIKDKTDSLYNAILRIQNDLFDLGADLATPESNEKLEYEPLRIIAEQVDRLEGEIDEMNAKLAPLNSFILPGGCALAAHLHMARTLARRAERHLVTLINQGTEPINPLALHYLNRLSDWLFVAARYANDLGKNDILWQPGANR